MFGLDNPSGVSVMPPITPASNPTPLWFTEGGAGLAVSYPGQEWFNIVQAELLSVLQAASIKPDKSKLDQLAVAIKSIVAEKSIGLTDKLGNSSVLAASQKLVSEVNDNANSKLAKNQNGADIPDKNAFVKNLGLSDTVELAKNSAQQSFVDANFLRINSASDASVGSLTINNNTNYPNLRFKSKDGHVLGVNGSEGKLLHIYSNDENGNRRYNLFAQQKSGTLATLDDIVPVGVPLPYPHRYTPPGYLTCNGQTFDKSLYPKLAEAYPAGRVPDLRGEFIRGWDDSRGVDPGRVCGTWQADSTKRIQLASGYGNENSYLWTYQGAPGGYKYPIGRDAMGTATATSIADNTGGHETRPRNIAFNYIVRAV
ncbi:tail fiber protein [Photorhabdus aegyptia]|uniref:Phage-related tail fiber protein n=1 Tax=Photorhabdus aegyptia TaxID=2805098 RepID=A0A022PF78_9GAMM|nr:tail fiber protein [Photorhabdus aegyptia]EYU13598.1 phage-related tail fiber protein [Photorhabdus aegyptia]